ncbi:Integral membrane sensor signal transduction histidine kinase [Desulfosarcina cetonica]|uniref:sensor histidine kinase n=1 Tax=Desulfosarcina cetonica TaxID=90730 RepID=UPI0006D198E7|nr:HAMP domain-containing sensor histidine kinase [Desulfosarcina cetonica]VTR69880.1 Integral membrane sensor signal transduction histidine kinase [Desulfosarcina cetonica]
MKQVKWLFHPILVFGLSVTALVASLFLYIYWYVGVSSGLRAAMERFNLEQEQMVAADTWVVILVLSILIGTILMGIFIIFVFSQKTTQLYRLQNNFINNFTHELKTPVTSLQLYLQTFSKYELPRADQLKYIQYMLLDVNRLAGTINRILNLAKLESKSYMGEFVVCDLVGVIHRFLEENNHLFKSCRIRVHTPVINTVYQRINRHLFEMLLINIITNAIKYNNAEAPVMDIFVEPGRKKTRIRFVDNGIGFDRKEMKKIFRKFYQIGRSDDMSAKGSGLGLHLVQNIARLHNGSITAESPGRGQGSTFTLMLPTLE